MYIESLDRYHKYAKVFQSIHIEDVKTYSKTLRTLEVWIK